MCLEAQAFLIKVNPATREERSMQAYWSRPLGCRVSGWADSLVRSLTLIHWTLIRMALPGLDASVITAFVSRSFPSPILGLTILFFYFIILVQLQQFRQTRRTNCWKKQIHDASESAGSSAKCCLFISFVFIDTERSLLQQRGRKAHKIINSQKSGAPCKCL